MDYESKRYQNILAVVMIVILVIDVLFLIAKALPNEAPSFVMSFYQEYLNNKIFFIILEFLGMLSLLVDLIGRYEQIQRKVRVLRLIGTALVCIFFLAKVFVLFIDSALLTD